MSHGLLRSAVSYLSWSSWLWVFCRAVDERVATGQIQETETETETETELLDAGGSRIAAR